MPEATAETDLHRNQEMSHKPDTFLDPALYWLMVITLILGVCGVAAAIACFASWAVG